MNYLTPIINAKQIAESQRYGEQELPFIERLVLGAQALLYNAGAFIPDNPLCKVVVEMIVAHWLENRDSMNFDMKNVYNLPIAIRAQISSLQFFCELEKGDQS